MFKLLVIIVTSFTLGAFMGWFGHDLIAKHLPKSYPYTATNGSLD